MTELTLKQRFLDVKSFFISFGIATVLTAIFGYLYIFHPELFEISFIRIDFIQYLICAVPIMIAGFLHGYRKVDAIGEDTRFSRIDHGLYYLQLYTLVGWIYGPCIWDNILIIYRVLGPEHLDLAAQMEIQFVFIYFLTISVYRFFTIIYVVAGTYFLLYVRKRSQILWVYLFFLYIYSSLVIGYIFKLNLSPTSLFSEAILIYVLSALVIFAVVLGLHLYIKRYREKEFN